MSPKLLVSPPASAPTLTEAEAEAAPALPPPPPPPSSRQRRRRRRRRQCRLVWHPPSNRLRWCFPYRRIRWHFPSASFRWQSRFRPRLLASPPPADAPPLAEAEADAPALPPPPPPPPADAPPLAEAEADAPALPRNVPFYGPRIVPIFLHDDVLYILGDSGYSHGTDDSSSLPPPPPPPPADAPPLAEAEANPSSKPCSLPPAEIEAILHNNMASPSERQEKDEKCTICFDDFEEGELSAKLECGHHYHEKCFIDWLKEKSDCPFCRGPFP